MSGMNLVSSTKRSENLFFVETINICKINWTSNYRETNSFSFLVYSSISGDSVADCHYIFSTNLKICIFATRFILNEKQVKMELKLKEEAERTFREDKQPNRTAVIGKSLPNGFSQFSIESLQPGDTCIVILECAFISSLGNSISSFLKFPLEVFPCTLR